MPADGLQLFLSFLQFNLVMKISYSDKKLLHLLTLARISCCATFARTGGGGGAGECNPLGVSKQSVVELHGKDKSANVTDLRSDM